MLNETSVDAVVRETAEEMGIDLDPLQLHYVMSTRIIGTSPNDIVNVFLYKLSGEEKFTYIDGEVDSYEWRKFDEFKQIIEDTQAHNLVNQGLLYFNSIVVSLEYIATGKKILL
jgi:8-oxo-dGTP pyrophosphatase MutT (NUDIX family)